MVTPPDVCVFETEYICDPAAKQGLRTKSHKRLLGFYMTGAAKV